MCDIARVGDRACETVGDLAALMPAGLAVHPAYGWYGMTESELASRPDCCLCAVDLPATARRNGYRAAPGRSPSDVTFRRPGAAGEA